MDSMTVSSSVLSHLVDDSRHSPIHTIHLVYPVHSKLGGVASSDPHRDDVPHNLPSMVSVFHFPSFDCCKQSSSFPTTKSKFVLLPQNMKGSWSGGESADIFDSATIVPTASVSVCNCIHRRWSSGDPFGVDFRFL